MVLERPSARRVQQLPGDPAGVIGRQERGNLYDIVGLSDAAERCTPMTFCPNAVPITPAACSPSVATIRARRTFRLSQDTAKAKAAFLAIAIRGRLA
jgi:hypothetical protein